MAVRRGVRFLATDIWDTPDDGKRDDLAGRFGPGSIFRPALFPGLEIPIAALWR